MSRVTNFTMSTEQSRRVKLNLFSAVKKGNLTRVRKLIKNGADIHIKDKFGYSLLHLATNPKIVQLLIQEGANINAKANCGSTPLMYIINHSRKDYIYKWVYPKCYRNIIQEILKHKPNVNANTNNGYSVLFAYIFIGECNINVINDMISLGADINIRTRNGYNLLHAACNRINCNVDVIKLLLQIGVDPNATTRRGRSPLHCMLNNTFCNVDVVLELLKHNIDLTLPTRTGYTPLHLAVKNPLVDYETFKALLMKDPTAVVRQDNIYCQTVLHRKLSLQRPLESHLDIIQLLLDHTMDVNAVDRDSRSYLHIAVINFYSHRKEISILLHYGVAVDLKDYNGRTALHYAFKNKELNFGVIEELITSGADISIIDNENCTPLYYAISNSRFELSHLKELLILCKSIDKCLCNVKKVNILSHCVSNGRLDCVKLLLKYMLLKTYPIIKNQLLFKTMKDFFYSKFTEINIQHDLINLVGMCLDEINAMMYDEIKNGMTFYHAIERYISKLTNNRVMKRCLIKAIIDRSTCAHYPLYDELLLCITKNDLIASFDKLFMMADKKNANYIFKLDQPSICHILSYLSKEDTINFMIAFYGNFKNIELKKKNNDIDKISSLNKSKEVLIPDFEKEIKLKLEQLSDFSSKSKRLCKRL